jgi:hypothetical protein
MKEISREEAERFISDSQVLQRELNQIGKELHIRFRLANIVKLKIKPILLKKNFINLDIN